MPSRWAGFSPVPLLPAPEPEPAQQDATHSPIPSIPWQPCTRALQLSQERAGTGMSPAVPEGWGGGTLWEWGSSHPLHHEERAGDVRPGCTAGSTQIYIPIHAGRRC